MLCGCAPSIVGNRLGLGGGVAGSGWGDEVIGMPGRRFDLSVMTATESAWSAPTGHLPECLAAFGTST